MELLLWRLVKIIKMAIYLDKVWSMSKRVLVYTFEGYKDSVSGIVLTSDDKFIVSKSYDYEVRVWNLETKKLQVKVCKSDNIEIDSFVSKDPNLIYITSDVGISTLNLSKKTLKMRMFFDPQIEKIYNEYPHLRSSLAHEISEDE